MTIDHAQLIETYSYNKETGEFTNKKGKMLGSTTGAAGHERITICLNGKRKQTSAGKLIFFYVTGRWPKDGYVIDHANGNPVDNRWENLREVTYSENATNTHGTTTTGYHANKIIKMLREQLEQKDRQIAKLEQQLAQQAQPEIQQ